MSHYWYKLDRSADRTTITLHSSTHGNAKIGTVIAIWGLDPNLKVLESFDLTGVTGKGLCNALLLLGIQELRSHPPCASITITGANANMLRAVSKKSHFTISERVVNQGKEYARIVIDNLSVVEQNLLAKCRDRGIELSALPKKAKMCAIL
jgi:hypothetical protein